MFGRRRTICGILRVPQSRFGSYPWPPQTQSVLLVKLSETFVFLLPVIIWKNKKIKLSNKLVVLTGPRHWHNLSFYNETNKTKLHNTNKNTFAGDFQNVTPVINEGPLQ